jgi:hypothetical protein
VRLGVEVGRKLTYNVYTRLSWPPFECRQAQIADLPVACSEAVADVLEGV